MKIESYKMPKSSFLSMEKDLATISNLILKNKRIQKLLFHTTPTALDDRPLTEEEALGLFGEQIKIVPKIPIDKNVLNYVVIGFDTFTPNATNTEFRDNLITFDIVCHFDQWQLKDFQLRPYRIAAEIDSMIDKQHLSGIGELEFFGASQIILNDEFGGVTIFYRAIHCDEDKKKMINPADEEKFIQDFNEMYNGR